MQRPLNITARDFTLSEAFEREIREKASALDGYFNRITGCDVTVQAPVEHHRKGGPFEVHLRLTVPGRELIANRQTEEGLAAAIREAFDAIRRQLEDYVREHRGDVKVPRRRHKPACRNYSPNRITAFLETARRAGSIFSSPQCAPQRL